MPPRDERRSVSAARRSRVHDQGNGHGRHGHGLVRPRSIATRPFAFFPANARRASAASRATARNSAPRCRAGERRSRSRVSKSPTCREGRRSSPTRIGIRPRLPAPTSTLVPGVDTPFGRAHGFAFTSAPRKSAARIVSRDVDSRAPFAARLAFDEPVVLRAGDRFVVRTSAPLNTIAGGVITDPYAPSRATLARGVVARRALRRLVDEGGARASMPRAFRFDWV